MLAVCVKREVKTLANKALPKHAHSLLRRLKLTVSKKSPSKGVSNGKM